MDAHLEDLAAFVLASPSSHHAAAEASARLEAAGFVVAREDAPWPEAPGAYVAVRDGAVIAWRVPERVDPARAQFRIVGAHTDSPGFKLKPAPSTAAAGWQQAGMEVYGGPLLNSWLDREFGLAGRVATREGTTRLVRTPAWLRIPQLAPHLDRSVNENLHLDRQQHLMPIYATATAPLDLLHEIATIAGLAPGEIAGHDLISYPVEAPAVFGADESLFASSRLDNLSSVHAGLAALLAAPSNDDLISVLACFDHEEVGSATRSGAAGPFLEQVLRRIGAAAGWGVDGAEQVLARSFHISADAGHAVHPNYQHMHDPQHRPVVNAGPLLKVNANQRYASDADGEALWHRVCAAAGAPTQVFVSNNAVACGSTIGPITATRLGIRTVDVGIPLLSMHSARELCGVRDPRWLAEALAAFLAGE